MVAIASAQNLSHYGIGASEISAVAGLNPFSSPWQVWCRKTGQAPELVQNAPMEWGHRLEPVIRQKYVDDTGFTVRVPAESMFHPEMPWARATPDGIARDRKNKSEHLLQCKNVGTFVEKSWHDAPPAYVQLQVQWEMLVTGLERDDIACLIGGNDFRIYTIHRDQRAIDDLVTIAADFWTKVERRIEPSVDESEACRQHFEKRFKSNAVELAADEDTEKLFAEWRLLTAQQKTNEKRIETIRNLVRRQLAEAEATRLVSTCGVASLTFPAPPAPKSVTNWKYIAELLGSKSPDDFAEIVSANTNTLIPEPKAPTLYAPRSWAKDSK
jgi:putative phage-type endonuclease